MKLNEKNLRRVIKVLGPCANGLKIFNKFMKLKKSGKRSFKWLFEKMKAHDEANPMDNYNVGWLYEDMMFFLVPFNKKQSRDSDYFNELISFEDFKRLFESISEEKMSNYKRVDLLLRLGCPLFLTTYNV